MNKKIHIIGGGTVYHLRPHFALCAPTYGTTARDLADIYEEWDEEGAPYLDVILHLTKMAGGHPRTKGEWQRPALETNEDISRLIDTLVEDKSTKIVVMNAAMCDFQGLVNGIADKYGQKLHRKDGNISLELEPAQKIVNKIRRNRKDIFAVAFKTSANLTPDEQYISALGFMKEASVNLVLANDVVTRNNMIVTPEEARYFDGMPRKQILRELVKMSLDRSHLTFTRSTVVAGDPIPWNSPLVPDALRTVVNYCINKNAYKPFRGATVGHFACKLDETTFLTSIRKSNFNDLAKNGLVKVVTDGPDSVIAYGSKPSVGGQSQRIIFNEHQEYDCVVHFHCPKKANSEVPTVSQKEFECGSHQCGQNTSNGLKRFGNLSAVYLDNHGPNIVFNNKINPQEVINFIEANFSLDEKTGGYVS